MKLLLSLVVARALCTGPVCIQRMSGSGFEPLDFVMDIRVDPSPDNRGICAGAVPTSDEGTERQACWQLDGEHAPITTRLTLKGLTGGQYETHVDLCRGRWDPAANTCSEKWIRATPRVFLVLSR